MFSTMKRAFARFDAWVLGLTVRALALLLRALTVTFAMSGRGE